MVFGTLGRPSIGDELSFLFDTLGVSCPLGAGVLSTGDEPSHSLICWCCPSIGVGHLLTIVVVWCCSFFVLPSPVSDSRDFPSLALAPSRARPIHLHCAPVRGALLDPGAIRHHQKHIDIMQNGWPVYFPLYELCCSWSDSSRISEPDSRARERNLSFMDFRKASQNLVSLIASHLASPDHALIAQSWKSHYDMIFDHHDVYSAFDNYLIYDETLRTAFPKRSQDFDPGEFQSHIWQSIIDNRRNDEMSEYRSLLGHMKKSAIPPAKHITASLAASSSSSSKAPPPASSSFRKDTSTPPTDSASAPPTASAPCKKAHCWFCGGYHRPKDCTSVGNGWLIKNSDGDWKGPGNLTVCFFFNGAKGCSNSASKCVFAHICSLCGATEHTAQSHPM